MNELSKLKPPAGSRKKRKRVGRGTGSGHGKTSGRGHKGQKARAASKKRPGFEGGQMPLQRRLPKRGFTPYRTKKWSVINVSALNRCDDGSAVTPESLAEMGLIGKPSANVRVLGNGELKVKLTVSAHHFSGTAREKITAKGGTAEVIGG